MNMIEYVECRFDIEEVNIPMNRITCTRRYVIYRVDIYCDEDGNDKKEVRIPIGVESDYGVALGVLEAIQDGPMANQSKSRSE